VADGIAARLRVGIEQADPVLAAIGVVPPHQVEAGLQPPDMTVEPGRQLEIEPGNPRWPGHVRRSAEEPPPPAGDRAVAVQQELVALPRMKPVDRGKPQLLCDHRRNCVARYLWTYQRCRCFRRRL